MRTVSYGRQRGLQRIPYRLPFRKPSHTAIRLGPKRAPGYRYRKTAAAAANIIKDAMKKFTLAKRIYAKGKSKRRFKGIRGYRIPMTRKFGYM